MRSFDVATLLLIVGIATGCAHSGNQTLLKEKAVVREKMGGKEVCWNVGLKDFTRTNGPKPDKNCLYPSSKYVSVPGFERGFGKHVKELEVRSVSPDAFVVMSDLPGGKWLSIQRTDEANLNRGDYIDPSWDGALYEHIGQHVVKTEFGSIAVEAFRKVSSEKVNEATKGLVSFNPDDETR